MKLADQILANDVQILIFCLSYIINTVKEVKSLLSWYVYCGLGDQHQKSSDIDIDGFYPKYFYIGVKLILNFCTPDYTVPCNFKVSMNPKKEGQKTMTWNVIS